MGHDEFARDSGILCSSQTVVVRNLEYVHVLSLLCLCAHLLKVSIVDKDCAYLIAVTDHEYERYTYVKTSCHP